MGKKEQKEALRDVINGGLHRVAHIEGNPDHKTQVLADTVAALANWVHILETELNDLKEGDKEE